MPADEAGSPGGVLDLQTPRRIHIVGIGGAGMSAIAIVLRAMGHTVSGSDLKDSPVAARLRSLGIAVAVGHAAGNVGEIDALTYSPAVALTNPEIVRAAESGALVIPVRARWPPSVPPGGAWRSPAPTARPRRRRCSPSY